MNTDGNEIRRGFRANYRMRHQGFEHARRGIPGKVYENALAHELRKAGSRVDQQSPIAVRYDDVVVGEYLIDLLVDGSVLVELKAVKSACC